MLMSAVGRTRRGELVLMLLLDLPAKSPPKARFHRNASLAARLDQKLGTQRSRRDRRPSRFAEGDAWMILQREKQPQECVAWQDLHAGREDRADRTQAFD